MNISLSEVAVLNCTAIASFIYREVNGSDIAGDIRSKGFDDTEASLDVNVAQNLLMRT